MVRGVSSSTAPFASTGASGSFTRKIDATASTPGISVSANTVRTSTPSASSAVASNGPTTAPA